MASLGLNEKLRINNLKELSKVIIYGYSYYGGTLHWNLHNNGVDVVGIVDNSKWLIGKNVGNMIILSEEDFIDRFKDKKDIQIVLTAKYRWSQMRDSLITQGISPEIIYLYRFNSKEDEYIMSTDEIGFNKMDYQKKILLYAGDVPSDVYEFYSMDESKQVIGLSLQQENLIHIMHDITEPYPIKSNVVDSYIAEDVLEHIEKEKVVDVINEVYRILSPGGVLKISLPDYNSELYFKICVCLDGEIVFDPSAGGDFVNNRITNGGHMWFPKYEIVKELVMNTNFSKYDFLCYRTEDGKLCRKPISGYFRRVSDNTPDELVSSIIVQLYK